MIGIITNIETKNEKKNHILKNLNISFLYYINFYFGKEISANRGCFKFSIRHKSFFMTDTGKKNQKSKTLRRCGTSLGSISSSFLLFILWSIFLHSIIHGEHALEDLFKSTSEINFFSCFIITSNQQQSLLLLQQPDFFHKKLTQFSYLV